MNDSATSNVNALVNDDSTTGGAAAGHRGPRLRLVPKLESMPAPTGVVAATPSTSAPPALTGAAPVQGTLALAFELPNGVPATPEPPDLQVLGSGAGEDLRNWAGMLGVALIEVVAGLRPLRQVAGWTTHRVGQQLSRHLRSAPTARRNSGDRGRARLRSVHVSVVSPEAAEATVVVAQDGRVRAAALRLQRRHGKWVCAAFVVA
jgi:hypothetical protein